MSLFSVWTLTASMVCEPKLLVATGTVGACLAGSDFIVLVLLLVILGGLVVVVVGRRGAPAVVGDVWHSTVTDCLPGTWMTWNG